MSFFTPTRSKAAPGSLALACVAFSLIFALSACRDTPQAIANAPDKIQEVIKGQYLRKGWQESTGSAPVSDRRHSRTCTNRTRRQDVGRGHGPLRNQDDLFDVVDDLYFHAKQ